MRGEPERIGAGEALLVQERSADGARVTEDAAVLDHRAPWTRSWSSSVTPQNSPLIRARALEGLAFLGVEIDAGRNDVLTGGVEGCFHAGAVALAVVASGGELMIALEAERIARSPGGEGEAR